MHEALTQVVGITLAHVGRTPPADILRALRPHAVVETSSLHALAASRQPSAGIVVIDATTLQPDDLALVAEWRRSPAGESTPLIFVVDASARKKLISLGLNHAANMVMRPLDPEITLALLRQLSLRRIGPPRGETSANRNKRYELFPSQAEALRACDLILDDLFGALTSSERIDVSDIAERSTVLIDTLAETGIEEWVGSVRSHHDSTYQHCLLVTGTLLAFGNHLRMGRGDLQRLAVGGLLHDLGKADVPVSILDKPAALSPEELAIMRKHTLTGVERLKLVKNKDAQLETFVRDHHELLDGSGYPNGLTAESISDPVRLLTIADIFAALIERRSYKPEVPSRQAIEILTSMGARLDQAILKSVLPVLRKVRP